MARPLRSVKSGPLAQRRIQLVGLPFAIGRAADALLKSAGFGEPTPPKNGGDAEAEGAAQPHKPTPPIPCGSVAALYEAMQQGVADAGAATQRAEVPAPVTSTEIIRAKWANSQEWLNEAFGPVSPPKTPPCLVLRRVAVALGTAAVLGLAVLVLTPVRASVTNEASSDRGASQ